MKDVAARAGVSPATASLVLRNVDSVSISEATRRRVRRAARALNYRHNALAAGLRRGRTNLVAFVVDHLARPSLAAKIIAAEAALRAKGMHTAIWHTAQDPEVETQALKEIRSQMACGLIVGYRLSSPAAALAARLAEDGFPLVLLEPLDGVHAHVVTVDRQRVMYLAAKHLLSLGHRRIAIAGDERFLDLTQGWGRGYVKALRERRLAPNPEWVLHLNAADTFQAGLEVGERLLALRPRPTGLVCSDDEVAIGVMRACREAGVRVPQELAVVGFDDLPVAAFAQPPLTTVGHPAARAGKLAARLLMDQIESSRRASPRTVILKPKLVVRASCAPPCEEPDDV